MAKIVIDFDPKELFGSQDTLVENIVKILQEKRYTQIKISKLELKPSE